MAAVAISVPLSRTYSAHEKSFDKVDLRAPVYSDYMALGDVQEWQPGPNGGMVVTYTEVIAAYVERICVFPGAECIGELSMEDTDAIVDAVKGFFSHRKTKSTGSPNSSSSGAGSGPGTSSK